MTKKKGRQGDPEFPENQNRRKQVQTDSVGGSTMLPRAAGHAVPLTPRPGGYSQLFRSGSSGPAASPGGDVSSESGEDNTQTVGKPCPHTARGVDLNSVRKNILKAQIKEFCPDCSRDSSKTPKQKSSDETAEKEEKNDGEVEETEGVGSLWLCLRCGFQGCGPPSKKCSHIAKHFGAPRSDCHALATNTEQWSVWCQECDLDVAPNSTKKLHECIEHLKRQPKTSIMAVNSSRPNSLSPAGESAIEAGEEALPDKRTTKRPGSKTVTLAAAPPSSSPANQLPRVKGLTNLGNTCFFNAVLQCLAQTPYLVSLLRDTAEEGESFFLPGCPNGAKGQEPVPPLEGSLGKWGALTEALTDTLADMQCPGGSGVVTPRRLLSLLSQRAPHLSQGDQQDSQELLRHLMEGVRAEELKRFQEVILNSHGLSRRTDPATVDESIKSKAKVYSQQASQLLLRPDQLFQGRLISTLQCQDCLHQSHTPECFLDLSLPIASDRPQPPLVLRNVRRDNSRELDDTTNKEKETPSKHQLKKERRLAHKNRKKRSRQNSIEPGNENQVDEDNNSEESKQSDADVEDNEDQESTATTTTTTTNQQDEPLDLSMPKKSTPVETKPSPVDDMKIVAVEDRGGGESGYATNGGTHSNSPGSPTSATEETDPNNAHASALCSELATLALNDDDKDVQQEKQDQVKQPDEIDDNAEKLNEEKGACALEPQEAEEEEEEDEEEEENSQFWSQTLAPRPPPISDGDGECSIQSCLNQFASIELLTGNNKVSCKTCTQRAGKTAQGKTVCTNSTKQLLVSAPPAILTLHLKRFEVNGSRFRKVSRHVSFPLILDLAPICSTKCRDLPSVGPNQTRLLYSLYGVVEHSGALSGGHYVAYVKSRKHPDLDNPRYEFLLSNSWNVKKVKEKEEEKNIEEGAEGGVPEPTPGKWFYISDSRVSEVSEKKVLQTQAYLLFYERIL